MKSKRKRESSLSSDEDVKLGKRKNPPQLIEAIGVHQVMKIKSDLVSVKSLAEDDKENCSGNAG
jgi:hypothetical protein